MRDNSRFCSAFLDSPGGFLMDKIVRAGKVRVTCHYDDETVYVEIFSVDLDGRPIDLELPAHQALDLLHALEAQRVELRAMVEWWRLKLLGR